MSAEPLRAGVRGPKTLAFGVVPCAALLAGVGMVTAQDGHLGQLAIASASKAKVGESSAKPTGAEGVGKRAGGALVICGGGKLPPPIRQRFCDLAGGPGAR